MPSSTVYSHYHKWSHTCCDGFGYMGSRATLKTGPSLAWILTTHKEAQHGARRGTSNALVRKHPTKSIAFGRHDYVLTVQQHARYVGSSTYTCRKHTKDSSSETYEQKNNIKTYALKISPASSRDHTRSFAHAKSYLKHSKT